MGKGRTDPLEVSSLDLVTLAELDEIRRIWVVEKHEIEDLLPSIYTEVVGVQYPGTSLSDDSVLGPAQLAALEALCEGDRLHYELTRNLLAIEWQYRAHARRAGLFERIDQSIRRGFFDHEDDATNHARRRQGALTQAGDRAADPNPAKRTPRRGYPIRRRIGSSRLAPIRSTISG